VRRGGILALPLLHPWILLGVHAAMHSWSLTTRERKLQQRAMAAVLAAAAVVAVALI